jgi:spermidine synthase
VGLIAVDGFDRNARAGALASQPFYEACRHGCRTGAAGVNLFGQLRGFKTQLQRLGKAFDGRVLALPALPQRQRGGFRRGRRAVESSCRTPRRAASLKAATGLDLTLTLRRLEKSGVLSDGRLAF